MALRPKDRGTKTHAGLVREAIEVCGGRSLDLVAALAVIGRCDGRTTCATDVSRWLGGRKVCVTDAEYIHIATKGRVHLDRFYPGHRELLRLIRAPRK